MPKKKTFLEGSSLAFVTAHYGKSNAEILALPEAKAFGLRELKHVANTRYQLKKFYGITEQRDVRYQVPVNGLKPGSFVYLVAEHLDKTTSEIVAIAKERGLDINSTQVNAARYRLRTEHKLTKPLHAMSAPPKPKPPKSLATNGHAPPSAAASGEANAKLAALRRLFLEVGYDAARTIFDEFTHLHERLRNQ